LVKKSLHHQKDFEEIVNRISNLSQNSHKKWGKMTTSQMLRHCSCVLQVPLKKIELPSIHIVFKALGILTKKEMQVFNNGIPRNMPTFQKLIINFDCDFDHEQQNLLKTLDEYRSAFESGDLPDHHVLFGKMTEKDWGFLEYKHLNHHLKQFSI
jgi:hypothetical protein